MDCARPGLEAKLSVGTPIGFELPSLIATVVLAAVVTSAAEMLWLYPVGAGTATETGCCASAVDESGALVASETEVGVKLWTVLLVLPPHAASSMRPVAPLKSRAIQDLGCKKNLPSKRVGT